MLCVRPGVLEAKASRCCCVRVLIQVDLPALERPTKAISGTSTRGRCLSSGAVVRNLAVCSQPMAILGSGAPDAAGACLGGVAEVMVGRSLKFVCMPAACVKGAKAPVGGAWEAMNRQGTPGSCRGKTPNNRGCPEAI